MNQQPHMHPVRDYFIYIDELGNVWKLLPSPNYGGHPPLTMMLLHRA